MGEALAIVIRFVQEDFKPTQRLIQLEVLAKALKGVELAQRLMSCLAVKCNFGPNTIIGGIRDGASVNGAALRQLKFFYSNLFDVVCFSHTIDNVGNHFEFRILDSFTQYWVSLFAIVLMLGCFGRRKQAKPCVHIVGTLRYSGRGRGGRQPEVKFSILGTN